MGSDDQIDKIKKGKIKLGEILQTLIKELETEKENLLRLIDEAVKEQEYLSAHLHSEALGQVNSQLQTLKNIDDPLYDKKHFLEVGIDNLRKRLKDAPTDKLKSMIQRFIDDKEKELNELNGTSQTQKDTNGKSYLHDFLEQFVKGKIRGLRIILSKSDNLSIEIRTTKTGTKLTMSNIKKLEAEYLLFDERILKLKGLGFSLNKKGDKATTTLSGKKSEMTDKIMRLISIIVFEVFYFKELGNEASIEILRKRTGPSDKH